MPRRLEILLTIAATALAVAFFASVPHWSKEPVANPLPSFVSSAARSLTATSAPLLGPSVLKSVKPAPDLNLSLPGDIAVVTVRRGINGETGLIPTSASITTFRLRATGDLVSVAPVLGADPIVAPTPLPADALRIQGAYAATKIERGVTQLRWTMNGITYEISSRTLDAPQLAEVANKLR